MKKPFRFGIIGLLALVVAVIAGCSVSGDDTVFKRYDLASGTKYPAVIYGQYSSTADELTPNTTILYKVEDDRVYMAYVSNDGIAHPFNVDDDLVNFKIMASTQVTATFTFDDAFKGSEIPAESGLQQLVNDDLRSVVITLTQRQHTLLTTY